MRSQVSSEFMILAGVAALTMMIFLFYTSDMVRDASFRRETYAARDIGLTVQNELFLASQVKDGYQRTFELPFKHYDMDYNISIIRNIVVIHSAGHDVEQGFLIPQVVGNITKGFNTVSRRGGTVYLNS
jgi:hypothetical protein